MKLPFDRVKISGTAIKPNSALSVVDFKAKWIKDPIFENVARRDFIHSERKAENNGEIQNIHTLYRKEWQCSDKKVKSAYLYITADDAYKLTINGKFIGLGPAPACPFNYPYNAWDIRNELIAGELHCIGVHTFYQGMHSLTFASGDNLQGLLCQIEITYEDQSRETLCSNSSWLCYQTQAYASNHVIGYQTAFSEDIDLNKLPVNWSVVNFDERAWVAPCASEIPEEYQLYAQDTLPLDIYKRNAVDLVKKGDGHYFIDFGTELTGETVFRVTGAKGREVEILHGEELDEEGGVRYDMRCNCLYQEICTLSGRENEILTFYDYKGFRYVEVLNWPEELVIDNIWAHERHYPYEESASSFSCSNPLLKDIWDLCANGVRVGTLDSYLDCPTREKGGFMGDGYVTSLSHLALTGDARILKKLLRDVADTKVYCKGLSSTAPNYINGELAEYSLLWPSLLLYYYQWTADLDFLKEMEPVLMDLHEYYGSYVNGDGLLEDMFSHTTKRYSVLVDWPANLRDDYDDPFLMGSRKITEDPKGVVNTMIQGFYLFSLKESHELAQILKNHIFAADLSEKIEKSEASLPKKLIDKKTGLFIDRNGSDHSSLHANVTPLMSVSLSEKQKTKVIELIKEKRFSCGVYFSFFVLKSLYNNNEPELAYDLLSSKDLHSWHSMLEAGATTCMEAWAPDLKWNTSWCHPWSSAPVHMISEEIMGLSAATPGWDSMRFAPKPPEALKNANIKITTPKGVVKSSFVQNSESVSYELLVPENCRALCIFNHQTKEVLVNGCKVDFQKMEYRNQVFVGLVENLMPGEHAIKVL